MRSIKRLFRQDPEESVVLDQRLKSVESFSQCGEDLILKFLCEQMMDIPIASYLDIGANHPVWLNNTVIFYRLGVTGVSIDPTESSETLFREHRPNERFLRVAIGPETKQDARLFIMEPNTLSTLSSEEARMYVEEKGHRIVREESVEVRTLDQVIDDEFGGQGPTILTMDIEGYESEVLSTFSFGNRSPKLICVESLSYVTQETNTNLLDMICRNGYRLVASTPVNSILARM